MQKEYKDIDDFLNDPSFRDWVLGKQGHRSLFWDSWCKMHPDKLELLEQAKEVLTQISTYDADWDSSSQAKIWEKMERKMEMETNSSPFLTNNKPTTNYFSWLTFNWAASIVFILSFISALIWWGTGDKEDTTLSDNQPDWIERVAEMGQKKLVHLPDGSTVSLNADTRITYSTDFGQTHRDIYLVGEAYFEVEADSVLPFKVISGNLTTTALGTAFNVKAFENEGTVQVRLVSGKVLVENEIQQEGIKDSMYLSPGEEATLNPQNFIKSKFDIRTAGLWKEGILYFDETPYQEVLRYLERWYNVEINSIGNQHADNPLITGEFERDHLDNVLKSLGYSFGFTYKIEDKSVTIQFTTME